MPTKRARGAKPARKRNAARSGRSAAAKKTPARKAGYRSRSASAPRKAAVTRKASARKPAPRQAAPRSATPAPRAAGNRNDNAILTEAIALTTVVADGKPEPITKERFASDVLGINDRTLRKKLDGRRLTPLERRRCEDIVQQAKGSTDGHYTLRDDALTA